MKHRIIVLSLAFFLAFVALVPLAGQTRGDVNGSGSIDIVDALLVAQYYVGLAPANFSVDAGDVNCDSSVTILDALVIARYYVGILSALPECQPQNGYGLTLEVAGKIIEYGVASIDMAYIDPPDQPVTAKSVYSFDNPTSVNLYLVSSTPPPQGDREITYQTVSFEGYTSTNIDLLVDSNKTVRILYATHVLPAIPGRTPNPIVVGDTYMYRFMGTVCVVDPEITGNVGIGKSASIQTASSVPGFTGSGYIQSTSLPASVHFMIGYLSTSGYYTVRLRIWNPDSGQWTWEGAAIPQKMQFADTQANISINFSRANYIVDRICIFQEGTADSSWQDLSLNQTTSFVDALADSGSFTIE